MKKEEVKYGDIIHSNDDSIIKVHHIGDEGEVFYIAYADNARGELGHIPYTHSYGTIDECYEASAHEKEFLENWIKEAEQKEDEISHFEVGCITIGQLAGALTSMSDTDIELLHRELRNHYSSDVMWDETLSDPDALDNMSAVKAETIARAIALAKKTDSEEKANLVAASWMAKYEKMREEKVFDDMFCDDMKEQLDFYKNFIEYLTDKAIGRKEDIIEAVGGNERNIFYGYVTGKWVIKNDKLFVEFEVPEHYKSNLVKEEKKDIRLAEWQASDNYAVWQTCGIMGDDYSGFLLLPCYKKNEYFCMYYNC